MSTEKKIIEKKLEKGILVRMAGNTTKAKSAPYKGISLIEIFVIFDI